MAAHDVSPVTRYPDLFVIPGPHKLSVGMAAFVVISVVDRSHPDVLVIAAASVRVLVDHRSVAMVPHDVRPMVVAVPEVDTDAEVRISVVHASAI